LKRYHPVAYAFGKFEIDDFEFKQYYVLYTNPLLEFVFQIKTLIVDATLLTRPIS